MAHIQTHRDDLAVEEPMLVEGLPGVGLVGKIAADHLVTEFEMSHFASIHCNGVPQVAVYKEGEPEVRAPVRLYADEERDLLVLSSDVPVSPKTADEFATCVTNWFDEHNVTPLYMSGLPTEKGDVPALSAVSSGSADQLLSDVGLDAPAQDGAVTGPTGALIYEAERQGLDSVGLIVESNKQFPDPEAARILILEGVKPLAEIDVETDSLVERAQEISQAKSNLAEQMQQDSEETTSAGPLGMYQ